MIGDVILRRTILLGWLVEDKLGIIAVTLSGLSNKKNMPIALTITIPRLTSDIRKPRTLKIPTCINKIMMGIKKRIL